MRNKILLFIAGILTSGFLYAQKPAIFSTKAGAIGGYDAVAYFTDSAAVRGADSLTYMWQGAEWKFRSADNLAKFKSNPEMYAPVYGGYCAFGVSGNYKAPTSPDAWTLVNGKLYLNYNVDVRTNWKKEMDARIQKADANWPALQNK